MPWSDNESMMKSMPGLAKLPSAAVSMFRSVANQQLEKGVEESTAMKIAWGVVKRKFVQKDGVWVARTDAFTETKYYTFDATADTSFITRTADGVELHNYVLTDQWPDSFGTAPTVELMNEWASWINRNQPEADADHEIFTQATQMFGDDVERVKNFVRAKHGIAKAVKATVKDGKLMVALAFDKRYANHIDRVRGLSIEAAAVRDTISNTFKKGELLGFTLAMTQRPSNPRAVRI